MNMWIKIILGLFGLYFILFGLITIRYIIGIFFIAIGVLIFYRINNDFDTITLMKLNKEERQQRKIELQKQKDLEYERFLQQQAEEERLEEEKRQEKIKKINEGIENFKNTYIEFGNGQYHNIFAINKNNNSFIVTNRTQLNFRLKQNFNWSDYEYKMSELLELKILESNTTNSTTTYTKGKTTTSTGSMLGRAVVGTMLLGPVGTIIGGATASKKHKPGSSTTKVNTTTTYSLVLFLKNGSPIAFAESKDQLTIENLKIQLEYFIKEQV